MGSLLESVRPIAGYVLQNQFFDTAGVAFRKVVDDDFRTGTRNDPYRCEEHTVVDFNAGNIGVENEIVSAANQLANPERNALVVELNLVAVDGVFETAAVKFFVWHSI